MSIYVYMYAGLTVKFCFDLKVDEAVSHTQHVNSRRVRQTIPEARSRHGKRRRPHRQGLISFTVVPCS